MSDASTFLFRGRYIPWLFVGGFAIVIAVNAVMIWFAVGSFSGLYSDRAREVGLHYNQVIAEQRARDALGWKVATAWRAESRRLELTVAGADGRPLENAQVKVELVRPVERRAPLPVTMSMVGSGAFAAHVDLPDGVHWRGNWDIDITIERDGQHYAVTRRMFFK
jgi:nitrogen fixation protein FixH